MNSMKHSPRIAVRQDAVLRPDGGEDIACTIVDVSVEGFRLDIKRGLRCGEGYTLSFSGETHRVSIQWASLGEAGGRFLD